jgi:hypothetical protein
MRESIQPHVSGLRSQVAGPITTAQLADELTTIAAARGEKLG